MSSLGPDRLFGYIEVGASVMMLLVALAAGVVVACMISFFATVGVL